MIAFLLSVLNVTPVSSKYSIEDKFRRVTVTFEEETVFLSINPFNIDNPKLPQPIIATFLSFILFNFYTSNIPDANIQSFL